jgi:hypothetical protein
VIPLTSRQGVPKVSLAVDLEGVPLPRPAYRTPAIPGVRQGSPRYDRGDGPEIRPVPTLLGPPVTAERATSSNTTAAPASSPSSPNAPGERGSCAHLPPKPCAPRFSRHSTSTATALRHVRSRRTRNPRLVETSERRERRALNPRRPPWRMLSRSGRRAPPGSQPSETSTAERGAQPAASNPAPIPADGRSWSPR